MTDNSQDTIVVLLIEDSQADADLIKAHLSSQAKPVFVLHHEATCAAGIARLREAIVDIVVLDLSLPDSNGLATFLAVREAGNGVPIVILSGLADEEVALEAVRLGAQDFFAKNEAIAPSLGRLLQYSLERFHRQKVEREIETAAFVQQRLYPKPLPALKGFEVAGRCDPANQVGGDYFDYFLVDENNLMLVIGDASGHGFGPSLVMAQTRAALRTMAMTTDDIGVIIHEANDLLHHDELGSFVSLFMARIEIEGRLCHYVSAGQPAELVRADGRSETLASPQPPLGIREGARFDVRKTALSPGDTLLLYTDGLSERSWDVRELFGVSRLCDVVAASKDLPAGQIIDRLFDAANEFANGRPAVDDMTAIVLKCMP